VHPRVALEFLAGQGLSALCSGDIVTGSRHEGLLKHQPNNQNERMQQ
jgi:hypothetical protein